MKRKYWALLTPADNVCFLDNKYDIFRTKKAAEDQRKKYDLVQEIKIVELDIKTK